MISINGLSVRLGACDVLRGVDLEVEPGETLALMGVSGSGKSTLLRAAVGLIRPDSGEVTLCGVRLAKAGGKELRKVRQNVGMLFQGNALFDSMTVRDNIGFVLREAMGRPGRKIKKRVNELLERLRLGPIGLQYPIELSGGMKKRVGIARALAHDPKVVLYDDPTAGLDPVTSVVIAELIAELSTSETRTSVVVTNQLPVMMKVASRVALLHQGKIIELGEPESVLDSDRPELKDFLEYGGQGPCPENSSS